MPKLSERSDKVVQNFLGKRADNGTQKTHMFTDGTSIYSYGHHFEIAKWTGKYMPEGREIVLFNSYSRSQTTGRHQGAVLRGLQKCAWNPVVVSRDGDDYLKHRYLEAVMNTFYRLTRALMNEDDEGPDVDLQLAALQEHLTAMSILGFKEYPGTPLFADDTSLKGKLCHLLSCRQQYGIDSLDDKVGGMSTQEYCFYKILDGKVVRPLKSVTDIYKYVRLLESNNSAEALTLIGSESPIIRKLAQQILEAA